MRFLLIALALHGCTKTPAPEPQNAGGSGSQSTKAAPVDAGAATVTPDGRPPASACGGDQDKLISKARGSAVLMFSAMDGASSYAASLAAWSAVAPGCRDGRWFYAAALLLAYRSSALEAGATKFTAVDEVLTAALAASGTDDDELLARIAYNAAMGRKPASPSDACARATKVSRAEADDATYVCAQEALASGDGKTAGELIAAMHQRFEFLDADLVAARAAKLRGDKAATKKFAADAMKVDYAAAKRAGVNSDDAKLVVAAAKDLLK